MGPLHYTSIYGVYTATIIVVFKSAKFYHNSFPIIIVSQGLHYSTVSKNFIIGAEHGNVSRIPTILLSYKGSYSPILLRSSKGSYASILLSSIYGPTF